MPRLARCPILVAALMIFPATGPLLRAADGAMAVVLPQPCLYIVVGFAGGFVRHDNPHHGPVKLAQRIDRTFRKATRFKSLRTATGKLLTKQYCACSTLITMASSAIRKNRRRASFSSATVGELLPW